MRKVKEKRGVSKTHGLPRGRYLGIYMTFLVLIAPHLVTPADHFG
jgi:hypothetical protein